MVHYYDYTASFKNFAWIGDIYQNYQHHKKRNRNEDNKTIGINNDLMTK